VVISKIFTFLHSLVLFAFSVDPTESILLFPETSFFECFLHKSDRFHHDEIRTNSIFGSNMKHNLKLEGVFLFFSNFFSIIMAKQFFF